MGRGKGVTPTVVAEIRRRLAAGDTGKNIAVDLGVAESTVSKYKPRGDSTISVPDMGRARHIATLQVDRRELERMGDAAAIAAGYTAQRGESLKARVLRTVCEQGPFDAVPSLCHAMRQGPEDNFGPHEVVSLLHSLNKQGAVKFRNSKTAPGVGDMILTRITATNRGYEMAGFPKPGLQPAHPTIGSKPPGYSRRFHAVGKDMTEPSNHGLTARGDEVVRGTYAAGREATAAALAANASRPETVQEPPPPAQGPVVPEPPAPAAEESFPLLEGLLADYARTTAAADRALKLMEAAELLAETSPDEARALLAKADEVGGRSFSPLEVEYLRFARAKGFALEE